MTGMTDNLMGFNSLTPGQPVFVCTMWDNLWLHATLKTLGHFGVWYVNVDGHNFTASYHRERIHTEEEHAAWLLTT